MQIVKESLDDGYCDISGNLGDITCVGELNTLHQPLVFANDDFQGDMGKVRFFCSKGTAVRIFGRATA